MKQRSFDVSYVRGEAYWNSPDLVSHHCERALIPFLPHLKDSSGCVGCGVRWGASAGGGAWACRAGRARWRPWYNRDGWRGHAGRYTYYPGNETRERHARVGQRREVAIPHPGSSG